MSNLTDFFGAPASSLAIDPHRQPCFTQFFPGQSNLHPMTIVYDHALRVINRQANAGSGGTGNRIDDWYTDAATGIGSTNASTTGYNVYDNAGNFTGSQTFIGGFFQGNNGASSGPVGTGMNMKSTAGYPARLNGTSVGMAQNYALFTQTFTGTENVGAAAGFFITNRSLLAGSLIENQVGSPGTGTPATSNYVGVQAAGVMTNAYRMAVGGVSYNQRTKKLVIIERDNTSPSSGYNTQWRPVLIHNAPNPAEYVNDNRGYQVALTAAAAVSGARVVGAPLAGTDGQNTGNANEDLKLVRPILCDDNSVIYLRVRETGQKTSIIKWGWSGAAIGGSFAAGSMVTDNTNNVTALFTATKNTTAQNTGCGAQWQMSLDGKTVILFSNTYYYGSGIQFVLINTETGGVSKLIVDHNTTYGSNPLPYGASNFLIASGKNGDSTGVYSASVNWKDYDIYSGGSGTYTGALVMPSNWWVGRLDMTYYTTCYPAFQLHLGTDNKAIVDAENGKWGL
jgi:hypothetical protein